LYDSLNWSFVDNSNSSNSDPTHIYQTDGVYSVRLSTNNVCGYSFVEKEITVNSLNTNNNHFTESSIFIYPNPAKNKIYVKSKLNQVLIIDIIDMVGKLQMEKRIIGSSNEIEINVEQLSKGMYIISIRDDFEVVSNQKIVIE
jgi:PKD repeat protein